MAQRRGLRRLFGVGTALAIYPVKATQPCSRRTIMKFENLMLHSLFAACLLVCVLTLGAMISAPAAYSSAAVASATPAAAATAQPAG
jgi:hypothetical protein